MAGPLIRAGVASGGHPIARFHALNRSVHGERLNQALVLLGLYAFVLAGNGEVATARGSA